MNKQKMTRTTELLKGCTNQLKWEDVNANSGYSGCGEDGMLCDCCKSELKGRLDALKEIDKFILDNKKKDALFILNEISKRIQKEIKEIEK